MNFVFRCDSSTQIGSGHLMRCLSLAEQVRKAGHHAHFICAPHKGSLHKLVEDAHLPLRLLSDDNLSQSQDADEVLGHLKQVNGSIIMVVDHYNLDLEWEQEISKVYKIVVIDDLERKHDCDLLIDPNYRSSYDDLYKNRVPSRCQLFLGPQYSFLREEFRSATATGKKRNSVLVFFGGTDPSNETLKFIKTLDSIHQAPFFVIVISKSHSDIKTLLKLPSSNKYRLEVQPSSMASLLSESQLFLGSGGTITWERMFLGVPGVVISVADNQTKIAEELGNDGQQIYLGDRFTINYSSAIELCGRLLTNGEWLSEISIKNRSLVKPILIDDVFAVLGVVALRLAIMEDAKFLYDLRNDESVRTVSVSKAEFSYEEHVEWLQKRISSDSPLFIILFDGVRVGQVRIDADLSLSIAVASRFRGMGIATEAISLAVNRFLRTRSLQNESFSAIIKEQNIGSVRSFEKAGFVRDGSAEIQGEKFLKYRLVK